MKKQQGFIQNVTGVTNRCEVSEMFRLFKQYLFCNSKYNMNDLLIATYI